MTLEQYLQNEYSKTSVNSYKNIINRYLLAVGNRVEKANYTDVLDYIGLLREQNLHPKSLRNNLFAIKIYYRYLVATGKRQDHPCQYLYLKDQINRQIQVESLYPKEILQELYDNWKSKNGEHQQRDKIIISLLIYQALTVLEISQLKVSDINLENGTINIKGNTKNKGRKLSLKPNQILLFHNYQKQDWKRYWRKQKPSKRTDYFLMNEQGLQLWQGGINRMINKGKDKQNKLIPLKIRQSVIAHLLKSGADLRLVQEFAGHRRTASTEAYKQTGLEELKSAIERLHPLQ
ncbi:MAG: tyrosine-type recombinase/integrase [Flavobacteriaceae bacterium]|nr:MAG: tyrosine-type recombinase/integrase [Flavobacteriaceae bacterium]QMU65834.1 MAG: tyrosine-type recombinase/integrase [Flavobacteriaceae bacterium]